MKQMKQMEQIEGDQGALSHHTSLVHYALGPNTI